MGKVQMVLGKLDFHMQKNEAEPFPYTICQSKLKTDQQLNLRAAPEVRRAGAVTFPQSPGRWPGKGLETGPDASASPAISS